MLHNHAVLQTELPNPFKPFVHAGKQRHLCAVARKRIFIENKIPRCLFHHFIHIRKVAVHIVLLGKGVRLRPKAPDVIADGLYVPLRLHIVGRQRLIEIIANRQYGLVLFGFACIFGFKHKFAPLSVLPIRFYYIPNPPFATRFSFLGCFRFWNCIFSGSAI